MSRIENNNSTAKTHTIGTFGLVVAMCIAVLLTSSALGQTGGRYVLSWSTIDGGGVGILIYDLLLTPPKDSGFAIFTPPQADLRY